MFFSFSKIKSQKIFHFKKNFYIYLYWKNVKYPITNVS